MRPWISTPDSSPTAATSRLWRGAAHLALALTLAAGGLVGTAGPALAQQNPYQRGPAPTEASIEATRGYFSSISQRTVSSLSVSGFGGGTIYYPNNTSEGTFGAIAIAPGFTADQSSLSWLGPRLASQGFVVFTIDTNSRFDQPSSRGDQLLAALDYLVRDTVVRSRIDPTRLAVAGHSMGGGGSLAAAEERSSLQAAIPLAPWNLDSTWGSVRVPTLIISGESDTVASPTSHAIPFYNSLPSTLDKAYLELDGASHFFPQISNTTMAKYMISWLKRFVDNDTRYEQFLCPAPDDSDIEEYRDTCPHSL